MPDANTASDTAAKTPRMTPHHSLAGIRLLQGLPNDAIQALESKCAWHEYSPEEIIFDLDDDGTDVCFIARGKLRILIFGRPEEGEVAEGHAEQVALAEMFTGDTFGELSAIDGQPRSAQAIASDNCVIAMLPRADMLDLLRHHPDVAISMLGRFAGMLRSMNRRVYSMATMTPQQRVYLELLRLSHPNPQGDGSWIIDTLPAHGDIADWAGAPRECVGTAIGQLAREGVVERRHRSLVIKNHARLRMLAHL
ncbi:MAG: Crp/Fnr family transcriptional regulator [Rhodospirillaceae bacterium]